MITILIWTVLIYLVTIITFIVCHYYLDETGDTIWETAKSLEWPMYFPLLNTALLILLSVIFIRYYFFSDLDNEE